MLFNKKKQSLYFQLLIYSYILLTIEQFTKVTGLIIKFVYNVIIFEYKIKSKLELNTPYIKKF